jgi:predicted nucleic acid-binding protein
MPPTPTGPGGVCFDATALILHNDAGELAVLEELFGGRAFTAGIITSIELAGSEARAAQNADIINAGWLQPVAVTSPQDIRLVKDLRRIWGSTAGKDHGEAEVIALCRRYGWTAIMDDKAGRAGCTQHGVPTAYGVSILVAASSLSTEIVGSSLSRAKAWEIHQEVEAKQRAPLMGVTDKDRAAFMKACKVFRKLWQESREPGWPEALARVPVDLIIEEAVRGE